MRNLKRVFSLALALVMVLGMMVITTSAASFNDAEEITYEEAVAVLSGVGLFKGDDQGNLNPTDVLTRKDAAVLMARIMLGGKYKNLDDDTARQIFSDVPAGEWYSAEVEYCYNTGLIGGMGDGTFAPNGNLTGIAFAKLLLCAMGHDAAAQGYTGTNWATSIYADALDKGLDIAGVDITKDLTREGAAQMILQAMNQNMVKYTTAYDYATGAAVVIGPNPVEDKTFRSEYFSKLGYTDVDGNDEAWGCPWDYMWTYNEKPLWISWYTPVAEYFTAVDECDIVKDLGETGEVEYTAYVDGCDNKTTGEWDDKNDYTVNYSETGTGVWTRIYDTESGYVTVAINTYFGQVTWVDYEKADKNGHVWQEAGVKLRVWGTTFAKDQNGNSLNKFVTDEDFARYDYVLINVCNGVPAAVELADYETETVKRISYEKNDRIMDTVTAKDGDVYGENVTFCNIYDAGKKTTVDALDTKVEYNLYLDKQGNIISAIIPADYDSFLYGVITRINWVDTNDDDADGYAKMTVVDMDAESQTGLELTHYMTKELEYADKSEDPKPTDGTVSTNRQYNAENWHDNLYEYKLNKKTGSYEVSEVAASADVYELTADTRFEVKEGNNYYRANNATKFLIKTGKTTYETYTGWKNVPELTANAAGTKTFSAEYFINTQTKYLSMVFIDATDLIWAGETELVYIVDDDVTDEDDGLFYFNAYVGTDKEEYVLSADKAEDLNITAKGDELGFTGLYMLAFNSSNEIIAFTEVEMDVLSVDGTEEGVMMVLEDVDEDFDIDEVPFYEIYGNRIVEGSAKYIDEEVMILTNAKGDLIAVYYIG